MKFDQSNPIHVRSEGKLIEVVPVITDAGGSSMMLPPVIWEVDNWLVGFKDEHWVGMPNTFYPQWKIQLPGSNPSMSHSLSFLVRLLENSPDSTPHAGSRIDIEAAREIVDALRELSPPKA
jgi:hypothetical protein